MMLFFRFFASWIAMRWHKLRGYRTIATPEEQLERLGSCGPCEHFKNGICDLCGCLVQAKIILTSEECPEKKWRRIWEKR